MARWFVCDMDDGVLRIERTRKAAVEWLLGYGMTERVLERRSLGPGSYEYTVGESRDDATQQFIVREDRVLLEGWDTAQVPEYPLADDPYEPVPRDDETIPTEESR